MSLVSEEALVEGAMRGSGSAEGIDASEGGAEASSCPECGHPAPYLGIFVVVEGRICFECVTCHYRREPDEV